MANTITPIVVEQIFNASPEQVWNAITDLEQMRQWFFENIEDFRPVIGFETQFNVQSQDRNFLHLWKLTEVVPLKKITYNWRYAEYPGDSFVSFKLIEGYKQTLLRLTHKVTESFPENIPEFERESGVEGWNYFIKNRLKDFLDGRK